MSPTDEMEVDDPPLSNIVEREARMDVDPLPPLPKGIPKVREGPPPQRSHTQPQRHPPPAPEPSGPQRAHTHKQPSGALLGTNVPKIQFHNATYSMNLHVGFFDCDEDEEYDTSAASRPPPYADGEGAPVSKWRHVLVAIFKRMRNQADFAAGQRFGATHTSARTFAKPSHTDSSFNWWRRTCEAGTASTSSG